MKKVLLILTMLLLMMMSCTATEEPEVIKVTVKYDCPVQEGIVTHIKDSVRFSNGTASFMLVKGQSYRLYAEAFEEDSTMWLCDTTFIASDSFIICKMYEEEQFSLKLNDEWEEPFRGTW